MVKPEDRPYPEDLDWSFLDAIWVINIYERPDRYRAMKRLARRLGMPVRFYRSHKRTDDPVRGSFEAHRAVIRKSYQAGHQRILVLEDDIHPTEELTRENLAKVARFLDQRSGLDQRSRSSTRSHSVARCGLDQRSGWDLFFLGSTPYVLSSDFEPIDTRSKIYRGHYYMAHAVILSRSGMAKALNFDFSGHGIDHNYRSIEAYAHIPELLAQDNRDTCVWGGSLSIQARRLYEPILRWWARRVGRSIIKMGLVLVLSIVLVLIVWRMLYSTS